MNTVGEGYASSADEIDFSPHYDGVPQRFLEMSAEELDRLIEEAQRKSINK